MSKLKYEIQENPRGGFDVIGKNHCMNGNSALYATLDTYEDAVEYLRKEKGYYMEEYRIIEKRYPEDRIEFELEVKRESSSSQIFGTSWSFLGKYDSLEQAKEYIEYKKEEKRLNTPIETIVHEL